MDAIYSKTLAGQEELAQRSRKLPARLRSLLVMIDGHRPAEALLAALAPMGITEDNLRELLLAGLIEPAPQTSIPEAATDLHTASETPKAETEAPPSFLPKWPPE